MNIMQSYFAPIIPVIPRKHIHRHTMDSDLRKYTTPVQNRSRNPFANHVRRQEQIERIIEALKDGDDTVLAIGSTANITETLARQILDSLVTDGRVRKEVRKQNRQHFYLVDEK